ncbi:MAG: TspO/MBR family protein [Nitrospira sp.]
MSPSIPEVAGLVLFLLACYGVAWFGARFRPDAWYGRLAKPAWTPPNWIFAPVWSVLYTAMAVAGWLVWREAGVAGVLGPLGLFALQLALNGIWTWLFFGLHRPDWALADIVALWVAIVVTEVSFWTVSPQAGALLLPYLVWVTFAGLLNVEIWRLNRG